jgi:glycosyltransferase involved in cell wall biosynthesis
VLGNATKVVSPSENHAKALERISGRPVSVVPNPVLGVSRLDGFIGKTGTRPRILCLGRFEHQKGFHHVAGASWHMPEANFYFVGSGREEGFLKLLSGQNCMFVGPVNHERALAWINSSDVVCCPSVHESFGLVAAEAAAMGKPVVATDVGIHKDVATVLVSQSATDKEWSDAIREADRSLRFPRFVPGSLPEQFLDRMREVYELDGGHS